MAAAPNPIGRESQALIRALKAGDFETALGHCTTLLRLFDRVPDTDELKDPFRTRVLLLRHDLERELEWRAAVRAAVQPTPSEDDQLNEIKLAIVNACLHGPVRGTTIARSISRDYDYVRHVLANLVRSGYLEKGPR